MPLLLRGPRVKIKQAMSQLAALDRSQQRFFRDNPYEVGIAEFDSRAGHHILRVVRGPEALPERWAAIVGEIAHDLRSALDGLAWQLALLNTGAPHRETGFPIRRIKRGETRTDVWREVERHSLRDIDPSLRTRIEAFQPYKRGNGGGRSPLWLVHELNRVDKHRLIPVVASAMGGFQVTGVSGGSQFRMRAELRPNARVGHVLPISGEGYETFDVRTGQIRTINEVEVDAELLPYIKFGGGNAAVKGLPVLRTLLSCTDRVSDVVESFAGEF